jgi:hypothetical protein
MAGGWTVTSPARAARIGQERARAVDQIRGMEQWMDENRRQVVIGGADLSPSEGGRCGLELGQRVATTVGWAVRYGLPVHAGSIRRLRFRAGGWMAYVRWDCPSLIPPCWFDADDLEAEVSRGSA